MEVYDLRSDLGETRYLAAEVPRWVQELDTLLLQCLTADNARLAQPNGAQ